MKNLWSREDISNFEKSEVFMELENRVLENIKRADILSKKIAELDINNVKALNEELSKAEETVESISSQLADDQEVEEDTSDDQGDQDLQGEVIDDLRSMAKLAIEEGNYTMAYKIERTIEEILEPEVTCE